MQHVCGEEGEHDVEVRAEEQNQANHHDHHQNRGRFPDIVQSLTQALPGVLPLAHASVSRRPGVQLVTLDKRQAHHHREKTERVEQKEHGDRARGNDDARHARTHDARQSREGEVQRNGIGQVLAPDHLDNKRPACWQIEAVREPQQQRQHIDLPELDCAGGDQCPEEKSLEHGR